MFSAQVEVTQAVKELWCEIVTINDLMHIAHGLAEATEPMLHPSVMAHTEVRALGAVLLKAWRDKAGHVEVRALFRVLRKIR